MASIKNILVTGANGQLGSEIRMLAASYPQYHFLFTTRDELSIADENRIKEYFLSNDVDCCINCAAYTAVDKAELEKESCFAVNVSAAGFLASACEEKDIPFFHFSTDYVFDGQKNSPYREDDAANPLNYYGHTKFLGEKLVFEKNKNAIIIRTSWVYSSFGKNFVKTMMRLMAEKETVNVVNDQTGSPTYAADLAAAVLQIIEQNKFVPGIYHYSNEGTISWYDFATAIKNLTGSKCNVTGIPASAYPTPAVRSPYSAMDTHKIRDTFNLIIPEWQKSLATCINLLQEFSD